MDNLQLHSIAKGSGELELSLKKVPVPDPGPDEIVIRVEATPINPSDLGLLLGPADVKTAKASGGAVTFAIPEQLMRMVGPRLDQSMAVGNEGAGTVVKAGSSPEAQALMGKLVTMVGGSMYATYRTARVRDVMVLPAGATAADGASCFVNPLTALGMTETMRREGHTALVHTAAASNLGQMLNKICIMDGIGLVNVVRSEEQAGILREIGAKHIVDSSKPTFMADLLTALNATKATLAFDAIGGGKLVSNILSAMEQSAVARMSQFSRYGSNEYKQAYIYGRLDTSPTELNASYGMAWGVGGWLLTPFLQKVGQETAGKLRQRVMAELKTTFASHYTKVISLKDALDIPTLQAYNRRATGEKYLINPSL
ncbi:MAG TPA: zinc-binding dehydrogenase [Hyphomonadaceae bacterium]|jgi:NADPH:quinone reductase-like Zn-dependent oxidoreductase|nr:zinc-binding dehydrogenase [Hyphomonadaceae bacterium]